MAAADHGTGNNHQNIVQNLSQKFGLHCREKIQHQQQKCQPQRQGGQIPDQLQGVNILPSAGISQQQPGGQEKEKGTDRHQKHKRTFRLGDKTAAGAQNKQTGPKQI